MTVDGSEPHRPALVPTRTSSVPELTIAGWSRMSTCDWPGKIVTTLFLQGCPWRCGYCHNRELWSTRTTGAVRWHNVLAFLGRRRGLLDGVVFSGGEATLQSGLAAAMRDVRDRGFAVGLHTAGPYPRRLAEVLSLVNWVGFDVKAPARLYAAITGVESSWARAQESLRLVLASSVDVQLRTTVDPSILDDAACQELQAEVTAAGGGTVVWQKMRPVERPMQ